MAQIVELADEELQIRKALPPEVNNVLSALWSGIGSLALALAALLSMIAYDLQTGGAFDWAGPVGDWLGWLSAGALTLIIALLGGIGSLQAVNARPSGLKLTKLAAIATLVLAALLSLTVVVLMIQGQFKLGPTPILAGTLLTVLGLLPAFLGGLTLSLATVEGVQQFFYPPQEAPPEAVEEAVEEVAQPEVEVSEEELERSLGELPTRESASPPVLVPGEVIRAELDESRLIRAELDTEASQIIRAELDEERLLRAELDESRLIHAELDEERLIRAEPASTTLPGTGGPRSDILEAPASPSVPAAGEIDIERIGDTSSRVLSRGDAVPESPSAVLLTSLEPTPSPSAIISELVGTPSPKPVAEIAPCHREPSDVVEPPPAGLLSYGEVMSSAPAESVASPAPAGELLEPARQASESVGESEEIFSAPVPSAARSETSAVDLENLMQLEFGPPPAEPSESETPVHLASGEPEIVGAGQEPAATPISQTPAEELPAATSAEATPQAVPSEQTHSPLTDLSKVAEKTTGSDAVQGQSPRIEPPLFPELSDALPPIVRSQPEESEIATPPSNPPSDELFRGIEESDR